MGDSPWQSSGPSFKEGRQDLISALRDDYPLELVEKHVDQYISENIDRGERYPFGSDMGYAIGFKFMLEDIKESISKYNDYIHTVQEAASYWAKIWEDFPHVIEVKVDYKTTDGKEQDILCIVVGVEEKGVYEEEYAIPPFLPPPYEEVPTDVVEIDTEL
jgi:hypothetical protein